MTTHEIRCEACGALNRVPAYSIRRIPECGRCRCKLPESGWALLRRTLHRFRAQIIVSSVIAVLGWVAAVMISGSGKQILAEIPGTKREPAPNATCVKNLVASQGFNDGDNASERPAVLTIRAASGPSYLVKLDNVAIDAPALLFFLEAAHALDARVPLGEFRLKYAAGNHWCHSDTDLFGDDTVFSEAADTLTFAPSATAGDPSASHLAIELPLQEGSKLTAKTISRDAFYGR